MFLDTEGVWQSRPIQGPTGEKKKREKESTKVFTKEAEVHSLAKNNHKILKCGQERTFAWWTNGRKGKNGLSKGNDGFQKGGFRPYQPDKGASKDYSQNTGKGKFKKKRQGRNSSSIQTFSFRST